MFSSTEDGLRKLAELVQTPPDLFRSNAMRDYSIDDLNSLVPQALDFMRSATSRSMSMVWENPFGDCRGI